MLILVDGQLSGVRCPNFVYSVDDYEAALESLHKLVNSGWVLVAITLLDEDGGRMVLPVDLFDGQSFQVSFQALQRQWQQVLAGSAPPTLGSHQPGRFTWFHYLRAYGRQLILSWISAFVKLGRRPV